MSLPANILAWKLCPRVIEHLHPHYNRKITDSSGLVKKCMKLVLNVDTEESKEVLNINEPSAM